MSIPSSGQISLKDIGDAYRVCNISYPSTNISLTALSTTPLLNTLASPRPDGSTPHAISEFYSYNPCFTTTTTTTAAPGTTTTTTAAPGTTTTTTAAPGTTTTTTAEETTTTTTTPEPTTTTTTPEPTTTTTTPEPTTTTTSTTSTTTTSTTSTTTTTTAAPSYDSIGTWGYGGDFSAGDACPPNIAQGVTELFVLNNAPIENGTTVYYESSPGVYTPFDGQGKYWAPAPFTTGQNSYIISSGGVLSAEYAC